MLLRSNSQYGMENIPRSGGLLRSYSFSEGDNYSFCNDLNSINNSTVGLKRSKAVSSLALSDGTDKAHSHVKLEYKHSNINDISAKDYISCATASTLPINNLGMSIDKDGHLILIKGKSYDLFKGLIKKYTTGYTYKVSKLTHSNADKKFQELYIDDNGLLIGNEKDTGKSYIINISVPEIANHSSEQLIDLNFEEHHPQNRHDDLTFKVDKDYTVSYFMKENKLYLKTIEKEESVKDYSFFLFEIKMPLSSKQVISSIKRVKGMLQLEIKSGSKRRVFYIDPKNISTRELCVSTMSHKAPQEFSTRLGNDPHEKFHAGLPFTSDRIGNFSSKFIPLFSTIVDNLRDKIKRAKQASAENKIKEGVLDVTEAIDPMFFSSMVTVSGLVKAAYKIADKNIDSKDILADKNISKLMACSTSLSKVANEAVGAKKDSPLSEPLITIADFLNPGEAVHLTSTHRIAAFFGISSGGLPFMPGWFAGIVMELSERYNLSISRTETGAIRLAFNERHTAGATALAGTGQGLERTLMNGSNVDYMTVMPFEANAIIAMQSVSGSNFSFDMSEEHFKEFIGKFSAQEKNAAFSDMFVNESQAEKIKEKRFVVKIECKAEARFQVGSMANSSTYMVMPRTAIGARLAIDLLNVASSSSQSAGKNEKLLTNRKDTLKITALNHEEAIFAEWKIMPIAMHGGGDDILWCYPLPLLEEAKALDEYKSEKGVNLYSREEGNAPADKPKQGFIRVNNIADIKKTPMFISVNEQGKVKKGIALKKIATVDKEMEIINSTVVQIKKALEREQRASLNKYCTIEVISHYEPIAPLSYPSSEIADNTSAETSPTTAAKNIGYRLKKLEFRRSSTLENKKASIPLPILNFSTIHAITYDQLLGEIEFQYQSENDLSPIKTRRKLNILY